MITTGNKLLDNLTGGYKNAISVIYGPAASGKTTLAKLAATRLCMQGGKIAYIDAEDGFSVDRFKQLVGANYQRYLDYILLYKPKNFAEQYEHINKLLPIIDQIDLIIIDTIGIHYRREFKNDLYGANRLLEKQVRLLKELSKHVPVIITNQVYMNIARDEISMIGTNMIKQWCTQIIELQKNPRKIILKKPVKKEVYFEINDKGITII